MTDSKLTGEESPELGPSPSISSLTSLADALDQGPDPPWAPACIVGVNRPTPRIPGASALSKAWQRLEIKPVSFLNGQSMEIPELAVNIQNQPLVPPVEQSENPKLPRVKKGLPKWAISLVVCMVVLLAIASTVQKVISGSHVVEPVNRSFVPPPGASLVPRAVTPSLPMPIQPVPEVKVESKPEAKAAPIPAEPLPQHTVPEHPYSQFVEVNNLHVIDQNGRAQVQYSVENHSAVQITNLGLHIEVRTSNIADSSAPLFTVALRVPILAPHQSKEIRTDLDPRLHLAQVPDRDNLKVLTRIVTEQ